VVPILKIHEMLGIADGLEPCPPSIITDEEGKQIFNPNFSIWDRKDQFLLGWINMSRSICQSSIYPKILS
jgi:hypothetical protein